ncbi:GNAT family N-acetyltransferase [Phycisphaerales bacterium AB-hyl4]|uniref:GNAT family N-acetyltransferase n=1 Tax=Natronomicrosphaera hydrolytica TaxID=3242702 RepID=A0ABV4U6P1_9BACT
MHLNTTAPITRPIRLRPFRDDDANAVASLLAQSEPMVGPVPPNPLTAADVEADYFTQPPNHLWIAEIDGIVVGVAGLQHEQPMIARLTQLCIDDAWEDADIPEQLLIAAVQHCHYFGYLKLVAQTTWPTAQIINLFARCGLRYTRHRGDIDDASCLLEFYVDLYRQNGQAHFTPAPPAKPATSRQSQAVALR